MTTRFVDGKVVVWGKQKRSVGEEMVWEMESDFSWSEKEKLKQGMGVEGILQSKRDAGKSRRAVELVIEQNAPRKCAVKRNDNPEAD
jgi:predicted Rdx family selenoprotein